MWLRRISRLGRSVTEIALLQRGFECIAIVGDLAEVLDMPAVRLEAHANVVAIRERGVAIDGDVVVVVDADQVAEALVAGERRGLVADAFHEAAVASDHERAVMHHVVTETAAQVALGERHADRVRETLSERTGRHFDAGGVADLGVTRRGRFPLAELLQVVEFEPVAGQEQQRVLQDRGVPVGQDEAIAVGPVRVARIVAHHPAVQHVAQRSERHRRALVAALRLQRCIHRHPANERDRLLVHLRSEAARHAVDCTRTVDFEPLKRARAAAVVMSGRQFGGAPRGWLLRCRPSRQVTSSCPLGSSLRSRLCWWTTWWWRLQSSTRLS